MDIQDQVGSLPKLGGDVALAYEKHVLGVIKKATKFRNDSEYKGLLPLDRSTELAERGIGAAGFLETVARSRELDTLRAQSAVFTDRLMQCHKIKAKILTLETFPHSAGEMLYVRKVHLHDPAVDAANELQAILILAHFYKAASCYGLVDVAWHDMDFVVAQHSIQKPFVTKTGKGNNAYAMLRYFLIDLGVEASAFAGGKLPPPPSQATVIKKSKKLSPYDSAFRAALLARHYTLQEQGGSRGRVFDFILTAMSQAAAATTGTKTRKQMRHFTPGDLLVTYKKEMIGDEPRLNFDYTTFTSFCLELLIKLVVGGLLGVSDKELRSLDKPHELVYFMMKDAAGAKNSGRSVSTTMFGRAAAVMQSMLSEHDNNRRFSQAALRKSSGRVPKNDRPEFTPEDPKVEANRKALAGILPDAAIGSSRQVLEIYDPNGSLGTFDQLLSTGTMSALMPGGRHARTVAMIPEGTENHFKKKVLAEGLELRDRSAAYEVLQRYRD
ncbi:hypothetical protein Slin15195_G079240 [Septoria linicola]|uniref:Uncharacterized protein n=1 Tax=Septoria linicola TaxID=215465 RepID=A0A9Q9AT18_9PEZI|nr:hypothetical protein Slin14017_G040440 [Septoria linicola]USW54605.1 hypothetical protein Slin15195_G079240 [Septoria linicola]